MRIGTEISGLAEGEEIEVIEVRAIVYGSQEVRRFDEDSFMRSNDRYETYNEVMIPPEAPPGDYVFRAHVTMNGKTLVMEMPFTIVE